VSGRITLPKPINDALQPATPALIQYITKGSFPLIAKIARGELARTVNFHTSSSCATNLCFFQNGGRFQWAPFALTLFKTT
jgi:hypothetical protein